jgi:hypothetical protein
MVSSGVALVITDVSEELSTSFIMVTRIGELGTRLAVTESPLSKYMKHYVRVEVFVAVTMKNGVFWCGSCNNRRFGETQRLLHHGDKNR